MRLRPAVQPPLHLDAVDLLRKVVKFRLERATLLRLFGPLLLLLRLRIPLEPREQDPREEGIHT